MWYFLLYLHNQKNFKTDVFICVVPFETDGKTQKDLNMHPWHFANRKYQVHKSQVTFKTSKIYVDFQSSEICKTSKKSLDLFESHFLWKVKNIYQVIPKVSRSSKRFRLFNSTLAIAKIINWLIPSVTIPNYLG